MALSVAQITQSEKDLFTADKPLIGANALIKTDRLEWRDAAGTGFTVGSDLTDSNFPPSRIIDNKSNLVTLPNTDFPTAGGHLLIDTSSNPIDFDFVAIIQHNLGTLVGVGGAGDIRVDIADDETFTTGLISDVAVFGPAGVPILSNDERMIDVKLRNLGDTGQSAERYSGVSFIRLEISGFSTGKPFLGEVVFGRRRQLEFKPRIPWGPEDKASEVRDTETKSGVITRHVRHKGRRPLNANLNPSSDPFRTDLITFYDDDTDFGTLPFIWIEDPETSPRKFNWFRMDPELSFPLVGPFERNLNLVAIEQGPDFLALDKL